MSDKPPQPLDYRAPESSDEDADPNSLAGCMGAFVGLIGLPFLIQGLRSLFQISKGWNRFVRSDDAYSGMISLVLGLFCTAVTLRWLWRRRARNK